MVAVPFVLNNSVRLCGSQSTIPNATKDQAASNAGFVIGAQSVAVTDTFGNASAAVLLLAEIRKRTSLPIKSVINTHHHLDHVAGNAVFRTAGAMVLAQRNVSDWICHVTPDLKALVEGLGATTPRASSTSCPGRRFRYFAPPVGR
jgi:glyoxylase-like metal-dependent hydrolase (beta-lactamase superfamily II)